MCSYYTHNSRMDSDIPEMIEFKRPIKLMKKLHTTKHSTFSSHRSCCVTGFTHFAIHHTSGYYVSIIMIFTLLEILFPMLGRRFAHQLPPPHSHTRTHTHRCTRNYSKTFSNYCILFENSVPD